MASNPLQRPPSLSLGVVLLALLQLQGLSTVAAWGAEGHHIVCLLAEPLLTPAALEGVRSLLPDYADGSLASLCTWPDDIRYLHKWAWSRPLHFIDTPDFSCNYDYSRDCHNDVGEVDMCSAGGINNYSSQLLTYNEPGVTTYNLTEALLFLAHFVGDIHQPLHVGFTGDAGGNTIILHFYTRKYNLHHVWDDELIDRIKDYMYDSDLSAFIQALQLNISTSWLEASAKWAACPGNSLVCPDVYARESISLACKWAYKNATPGSTLGDDYFFTRVPIVEQQLARGGVRLAAVLNRIFSPDSTLAVF